MPRDPASAPPWRCLVVWLAVGAFAALLGSLLRDELTDLAAATGGSWRTADLEQLLTWLAAVSAAAALTWLWTVSGLVALAAARGARRDAVPGCPAPVRRLVLAACGVAVGGALLGPLASPALAEPGPAPMPVSRGDDGSLADGSSQREGPGLDGLPLPDRAPSGPDGARPQGGQAPGRGAPARPDLRVVAAGDSLWDLAAAELAHDLGREATAAEVDRRWRTVHRLNTDVVGSDPDVIQPGQRLRMPGPDRPPSDPRRSR